MAKTIKELAEEYAYTNWEDENYHEGAAEGLPFDPIGHTEKTYIAGANAVLEIFSNIIANRNFAAFPRNTHNELTKKIKELKGE